MGEKGGRKGGERGRKKNLVPPLLIFSALKRPQDSPHPTHIRFFFLFFLIKRTCPLDHHHHERNIFDYSLILQQKRWINTIMFSTKYDLDSNKFNTDWIWKSQLGCCGYGWFLGDFHHQQKSMATFFGRDDLAHLSFIQPTQWSHKRMFLTHVQPL